MLSRGWTLYTTGLLQRYCSSRVTQNQRSGWKAALILPIQLLLCILTLHCIVVTGAWAQQTRRPLIFIPGILGSKLVDEKGKLLWGGRDSYFNFHKLRLPRDNNQIKLKPDGVIDTIPIVWPLEVKQYNDLLKIVEDIGFRKGENFFVFAYDWRRSNFKTAEILNTFIDQTPALKGKEFDIVAHSMGGLVALILIHEFDSGAKVKNLITLGTPFYGSLNAFDTFLNGFDGVSGFMAGMGSSSDKVRSVMFSFESGYELLPSYTLCCILGKPLDPDKIPKDIFTLGFWQNEWLPSSFSGDDDKKFIADALKQGKRLSQLVRKALPESLNMYMYAGDKFETKTQVYFDRTGNIDTYTKKKGDGTVWINSAARDKVQESRVSFEKHARIFEDDHLHKGLQRILAPLGELEDFAASAENVEVASVTGKQVQVELISFEVTPPIVSLGNPVKVLLYLSGVAIMKSDEKFDFSVCASAASIADRKFCYHLTEVDTELNSRRFQADFLPTVTGDYVILVSNYEKLEDYFAVVGGN